MRKQMFQKGDLVRIIDKLPANMSHFTAGMKAKIVGSYADIHGGSGWDDKNQYSIHIIGGGECAWYPTSTLRMVRAQRYCPECGAERKL